MWTGLSEEEADEDSITSGCFANSDRWIERVRNWKPAFATDVQQSRVDYRDVERFRDSRELLYGFLISTSQQSIYVGQQLDVWVLSRYVKHTESGRI